MGDNAAFAQASFRVSQGGSTLSLVSCNRSQEFAIGPQGLRQHTLAGEQRGGAEVRVRARALCHHAALSRVPALRPRHARLTRRRRRARARQCSASDMMEFNVIGRGASSVVRRARAATHAFRAAAQALVRREATRQRRATRRGRTARSRASAASAPRQVKKAIHVPSHRFVALKCICVLEKARARVRQRASAAERKKLPPLPGATFPLRAARRRWRTAHTAHAHDADARTIARAPTRNPAGQAAAAAERAAPDVRRQHGQCARRRRVHRHILPA
jgi:hypothetical protein